MKVIHGAASYRVGQRVAEAVGYRLYICQEENDNRQLLLQIADSVANNGGLERAAFLLKQLRQTADAYESKHAEIEPGKLLSYERLFPELVNGFRDPEQGNRRLNILAFSEVDDVRNMVPLSNLVERDNVRIALPSSAWVMGRLLKLLDFIHGQGIAACSLGGNNVLLEPGRHFAVLFDWASAVTYRSKVPRTVRGQEIAQAAQSVFRSIGGNPQTGEYPYNAGDGMPYVSFLWDLASGREYDALHAHHEFYDLVEKLWGREFRKFETLPL